MPLPDDYLNIDTPENVAFGYEVAGIGSRFLAAIVDTLLIIILQIIVNLTLLFLIRGVFEDLFTTQNDGWVWLIAVFGLVAFALLWGYYIFFEMAWNGQSPGKRWAGLRVIRTDGTPITLTEAIIRNLVRLIDFLPAYYGVGVVTMFINEQSRRLGDLAAGTLVVRDQANLTLGSLMAQSTLNHPSFLQSDQTSNPDLPVERLTEQDLQLAEEFLYRQRDLHHSSVLAQRIVKVLFERMGLPLSQINSGEAEKLIAEIVQAGQKSIDNEP